MDSFQGSVERMDGRMFSILETKRMKKEGNYLATLHHRHSPSRLSLGKNAEQFNDFLRDDRRSQSGQLTVIWYLSVDASYGIVCESQTRLSPLHSSKTNDNGKTLASIVESRAELILFYACELHTLADF